MAKSVKLKEADTFIDTEGIRDFAQGKTQKEINASMIPTDVVTFTEKDYTVTYCKSGSVATVMVYTNGETATDIDTYLTRKLPFRTALDVPMAFSSYIGGQSFLQLFENGDIRVVHVKNSGWYKCVATFIAKDL